MLLNSKNKIAFSLIITALFLGSCVPQRQFSDLKERRDRCEAENATLKASYAEYETKTKELEKQNAERDLTIARLKKDTTDLSTSMGRLNNLYNDLTKSYDKLVTNEEKIARSKDEETRRALTDLDKTRSDLLRKEDALKLLEKEVTEKQKNLENSQLALTDADKKLKEKEARVVELQEALARKDSIVSALKTKVTDALVGYNNNGLTITQKNGKVYVSLEERLLFASGSTTVDKKGIDALKQLSKVLEENPDINVLIEGHTDNVPISGGNIKDNWDLSVLRSTSVVRILIKESKIDPLRLTPAGKGEYNPVDIGSSAEARKKNRRIEVILSPKLDEIFKMMGTN
ncbi:MAG: OmpA family protein [Bacteroidetes bacterium]|nr:OmpA family protein [Bacteroidota bacterium]MBL0050305.1 OmpA family protein [Bacteroidota bacterium]